MSGTFIARIRVTDSFGNETKDDSDAYFNVFDPSTVDGPFTTPEPISTPSQNLGEVDLAVDTLNFLDAAWGDNFNLYYRQKTDAGWQSIQQLTTNNTVKTNGENHVLISVDSNNSPHIIYKSTNIFTNSHI